MKRVKLLYILISGILFLSTNSYAFFIGFGTSGGADAVIKDGQDRGLIPKTADYKLAITYWTKLESNADITSPQAGTNGFVNVAPGYFVCKFGLGADCNAANMGWYVPASSILNRYRGCIEFWYKPHYALPGAVQTYAVLGDNTVNNSYCDMYFSVLNNAIDGKIKFSMRRSSNGWADVEYYTNWGADSLVHIALVWDMVGFNAGGTTHFQAIYMNGSFVAGSANSEFNTDWTNTYINFGYSTDIVTHANGVIDNLKIYNYAKTDFSDRNTE